MVVCRSILCSSSSKLFFHVHEYSKFFKLSAYVSRLGRMSTNKPHDRGITLDKTHRDTPLWSATACGLLIHFTFQSFLMPSCAYNKHHEFHVESYGLLKVWFGHAIVARQVKKLLYFCFQKVPVSWVVSFEPKISSSS